MQRGLSITVVLTALAGLGGCGPKPEPMLPVTGKITVKGQPVAGATVAFFPASDKGNASKHEPRAVAGSDGVYELKVGDKPGAPPGWYRITVFAMKNPGKMAPPEWLASKQYTDVKTSGLIVEVMNSPTAGAYDFDLKP